MDVTSNNNTFSMEIHGFGHNVWEEQKHHKWVHGHRGQ
jgi:hypothetical protein